MFGSIAYDIYYLYSPESRLDFEPSPLVSSGYTIMAKRDQLAKGIARLLES